VIFNLCSTIGNTLSGYRNVSISGVKTADGVVMHDTVDLVENVAPTFTAAVTDTKAIAMGTDTTSLKSIPRYGNNNGKSHPKKGKSVAKPNFYITGIYNPVFFFFFRSLRFGSFSA